MTRTLRFLVCSTVLSAAASLSGCCYAIDACAACLNCALTGPSLNPFAVPLASATPEEVTLPAEAATTQARAAMSY